MGHGHSVVRYIVLGLGWAALILYAATSDAAPSTRAPARDHAVALASSLPVAR
jgi:hypothetical protein